MNIGIITASSQSGRAYFADLKHRGYSVNGYSRPSEHGIEFANAVNDLEGIFLDRPKNSNGEVKSFIGLGENFISHDLKKLIETSDYIIVSQPSHYLLRTVREMKKFGLAESRIPLILSPSRSFSTPYLWKELGEMYPIASFSTCPYSCKSPRPDTAYIKRRKRNWLASLEGEFSLSQVAELGQIFPQAIFNSKPITTTMGNIGAIFHPGTYLLNYEIIKQREAAGKTFSFYIEGIAARPEVGKMLEEIDQIRLGIAHKSGFEVFGMKEFPREEEWKKLMDNIRTSEKASHLSLAELRKIRHDGLKQLNYSLPSCQHWLEYTYGVNRIPGESLSDAIGRTPTYQNNSVPQKRYVDEDIPTGIIPLRNYARRLGINVKAADDLIELCDRIYPGRDKSNDRTLEEFTDSYLKDYLAGKFFRIID